MVSKGSTTLSLEEILNSVSELELLAHYLNINKLPTLINSPLREDNSPSFGLYSPDGRKVRYKDFATNESGSIIELLGKIWHCSFKETLDRIVEDYKNIQYQNNNVTFQNSIHLNKNIKVEVKVREWQKYDIDYWNSYGIPIKLLKSTNVYPISHYMITKNKVMTFVADKLAYAYVEFKEGNVSIKVYQPYNKQGFKWISGHDKSVLGLWNHLPKEGEIVCICSSVKDALCLTANIGIPAICLQGEGYNISKSAQTELKNRFKKVCILLDSDETGINNSIKLAEQTGFINIQLPVSDNYKDIAEFYTFFGKQEFRKQITKIIQSKL